jgi:Rps23 Pro-64 3,4-dihydroxylase Tpa1-like proline 4-hydroxylase
VPIFQEEHYEQQAERHRQEYATAQPFPHIVLDNFLPTEICEKLLEEFPTPEEIEWLRFERHHSKKLATRGDDQFGEHTRALMHQMNGAAFLQFLETLTGIKGLIPDPYLEGGGLHQIERGGYLKVHADFNWHKRLNLDRRLNFILYVNKDWREEYNGHLELWDRGMTHCVRKILPIYNRCVIFSTTSWAYHGHPEKLACPPGWTRKSLALYYYTNGRPEQERGEKHGTLWQERPRGAGLASLVRAMRKTTAAVVKVPSRAMRRLTTRLR